MTTTFGVTSHPWSGGGRSLKDPVPQEPLSFDVFPMVIPCDASSEPKRLQLLVYIAFFTFPW